MAEIRIDHRTNFSQDEVRAKVDTIMGKVEEKFGLKGSWKGNRYTFSRTGAEGTATIGEGKVTIVIELSMLLSALKKRIESELKAKLEEGLP